MQAGSIDFDKYITSYPDFSKLGVLFGDISLLLASAREMNCAINQLAGNDWVQQLALGARLSSKEVLKKYRSFR